MEGNGGPIIDMCGHYFDQWRMIFDAEPVRVTARGLAVHAMIVGCSLKRT